MEYKGKNNEQAYIYTYSIDSYILKTKTEQSIAETNKKIIKINISKIFFFFLQIYL